MYRTVKPEFNDRDHNIARVKLAFLKENHKFREFFLNLKKDPYSQCPQFRKPSESGEEYRKRISFLKYEPPGFLKDSVEHFTINYEFVSLVQERDYVSATDILNLLDPQIEIDESLCQGLLKLLPLLFNSHGVYGFRRSRGSLDMSGLNLYERLLKIDLRQNKTRLIEEFKQYIKHERRLHAIGSKIKLGHKLRYKAFDWDVDDERYRKEAWEQLEVWRLRKKQVRQRRLSFKEIAKKQRETEDNVKHKFYRAYERIYGRTYKPTEFHKLAKVVGKEEIKKTCQTCTDKKCQNDMKDPKKWTPCPDVLPYVDQDIVDLKESNLKEDSDSYKDYLLSH